MLLSIVVAAPALGQTVFPQFRTQEIETKLKVGYAVLLVDVNGDGKTDIVVVDTNRVVWYENPTWKRRIIIEGMTKPDNVCIAAYDIDGDGKLDFALGADWKPFNTKSGGTLQWLKRGKTLDEPWTRAPHRRRSRRCTASASPTSTATASRRWSSGRSWAATAARQKNWMDGKPVRMHRLPHPEGSRSKDRWVPEVLDESLHVIHNFWPHPRRAGKGMDILTRQLRGRESLDRAADGKWTTQQLGTGNQDNPKGNRGASEIKQGKLKNGKQVHRHHRAVARQPGRRLHRAGRSRRACGTRHVIDDEAASGATPSGAPTSTATAATS